MQRPTLLLAAAALAAAGCTSGDFRRVALTRDLGPGDVAHFESLAHNSSGTPAQIEDYFLGLPFCPVICGSRETTADRAKDGRTWYHVEDDNGLLLYLLAGSSTVANFGPDGRSTDWTARQTLLLGAVTTWRGERSSEEGRVASSGFKLLWGLLFSTSSDGDVTRWSLLMIPFGG